MRTEDEIRERLKYRRDEISERLKHWREVLGGVLKGEETKKTISPIIEELEWVLGDGDQVERHPEGKNEKATN